MPSQNNKSPETSCPEIPLKILAQASRYAGIRKNTSLLGWCKIHTTSVLDVKNRPVCPRENDTRQGIFETGVGVAACVRVDCVCVRANVCSVYCADGTA